MRQTRIAGQTVYAAAHLRGFFYHSSLVVYDASSLAGVARQYAIYRHIYIHIHANKHSDRTAIVVPPLLTVTKRNSQYIRTHTHKHNTDTHTRVWSIAGSRRARNIAQYYGAAGSEVIFLSLLFWSSFFLKDSVSSKGGIFFLVINTYKILLPVLYSSNQILHFKLEKWSQFLLSLGACVCRPACYRMVSLNESVKVTVRIIVIVPAQFTNVFFHPCSVLNPSLFGLL